MKSDQFISSRVVLPSMGFAVLGLFSFGLTCAVLLVRPEALAGDPTRPLVLGLTHLITLGWIGSLLFAGAYLFGPILAGDRLWSEMLPGWHLLAHVAGLGLLVFGLVRQDYSVAGFGGLILCLGLGLLILNLQVTGNRKSRWTPAHLTFQAALFWLGVTGALALYILRSRLGGSTPFPLETFIALHAHYALFGFLVQVLLGVSLRMVPRLLGHEEECSSGMVWAGWGSLNFGLLMLFPAAVSGSTTVLMVAGGFLVLGVLLYTLKVLGYILRHCKEISWGVATHATGLVLLSAIALAAIGRYPVMAGDSLEGIRSWMRIYISLALLGPFAFTIFGTAERMLPRMIWSLRFAPWTGHGALPSAESLARPAAGGPVFLCLLFAWSYLAYGQIFEMPDAIRLGALLLLASFAWFLVGVSPALARMILGVTPADLRAPNESGDSTIHLPAHS